MYHYTYISTDNIRYYIGVRSSKITPEEDNYFGSFYDKTFKPTSKRILGLHSSREDAILAEIYWHKIFKVKSNPLFVNRANQTNSGFDYDWTGKKYPQEAKDKISKKVREYYKNNPHPWIGRKHTEASKEKMSKSLSGKNSPWYGKKHKNSTKKKQSEARKNKTIYHFFCCATSEEYIGIVYDFYTEFGFPSQGPIALVSGKLIHYKDWIII